MEYFKNVLSEYVVSYGCGRGTVKITRDEYERIKEISLSAPPAPSGYIYKLRSDNLEWVLVEVPEPEPYEEEASPEDYENALAEMGVDFSD